MMKNNSKLLRGSIEDNQFRLFAADTTDIVQKARDLHDLFPLPSILMGRLISAVALMSGELKAPKAEISLQVDGDGILKGGIAIADKEGNIKAYAYEPKLWLKESGQNFEVGKNLGRGYLSVIRQSGLKEPYTGKIELLDGEIATDLAAYYDRSEQTASAVNLGILIDKSAKIRAAGGVLIQQLPDADPALTKLIFDNLQQTPNVSDLMDMGLSIDDILKRFILKNLRWQINQESPLQYLCNCSKERYASALRMLGKAELLTMLDGIETVCHYCNRNYTFSPSDINQLIQSLDQTDEKL